MDPVNRMPVIGQMVVQVPNVPLTEEEEPEYDFDNNDDVYQKSPTLRNVMTNLPLRSVSTEYTR
jgi:hypothetical protein